MPVAEIAPGDTFPADGEVFVIVAGVAIVAGVVMHPRIAGAWLATWKPDPQNIRDSGMKRFKTRRGAVAHVQKKLADSAIMC